MGKKLSVKEYRRLTTRPKKKNKFRAQKTVVGNRTFDSKKEAARFAQLGQLQQAGIIHSLELQPEFPIWINGIKVFTYRADFAYFDVPNSQRVIEDVKGFKTQVYILKRKAVEAYYTVKITEV